MIQYIPYLTIFLLIYVIKCNDDARFVSNLHLQQFPFSVIRTHYNKIERLLENIDREYDFFMTYHATFAHNNHMIPLIRYFDIVVDRFTVCNWHPCIYISKEASSIISSNQTIAIFISTIKYAFFIEAILPYFEDRFKKTGHQILLFSGNGDSHVTEELSTEILSHGCIKKWAVTQNILYSIQSDPRVLDVPIGLFPGAEKHSFFRECMLYASTRHLAFSRHPPPTALSEVSYRNNWHYRKDKILVCFQNHTIASRQVYIDWARANCSLCDVCNGLLPMEQLWDRYGDYKFVLSPHGNGPDCEVGKY